MIVLGHDILCSAFLDGDTAVLPEPLHLIFDSHPHFILHVTFTWTNVWRNQIIRILKKRNWMVKVSSNFCRYFLCYTIQHLYSLSQHSGNHRIAHRQRRWFRRELHTPS